jgi:hypothetical protein
MNKKKIKQEKKILDEIQKFKKNKIIMKLLSIVLVKKII